MATYWIVLLLVIVDKLAIFETCRSGIECPSHKPFCSSLGCLNTCPEPFECVEKCPYGKLILNNTCVDICTDEAKYQYDGSCLQSCPSGSPFGLEKVKIEYFFEITKTFICIDSCEDNQLFLNGKCVYYFQCKYPMFGFQGQCLLQCPAGSVYTFSGGCLSIVNVIILILVIIGTLGVICIYTRKIIRDCAWVCFFMFTDDSSLIAGLNKVSRDANQFQLEMDNLTVSTETVLGEQDTVL